MPAKSRSRRRSQNDVTQDCVVVTRACATLRRQDRGLQSRQNNRWHRPANREAPMLSPTGRAGGREQGLSQLAPPRWQRGHRNIELVHDTGGLIFQTHNTMKLFGKATDKARPKTAPGGLLDRRAALLGPCEFEPLRLFIDRLTQYRCVPSLLDKAPYLTALVQSSLSDMVSGRTAPAPTSIRRVLNDKPLDVVGCRMVRSRRE